MRYLLLACLLLAGCANTTEPNCTTERRDIGGGYSAEINTCVASGPTHLPF